MARLTPSVVAILVHGVFVLLAHQPGGGELLGGHDRGAATATTAPHAVETRA